MVKNKIALSSSIVLFIVCLCLSAFIPIREKISAYLEIMSFPILNTDGFQIRGIVGAILLIFAFVLLVLSLNKFRVRTFFIAVLVYAYLPTILMTIYQETFAKGVSAISYDGNGNCEFENIKEDIMRGKCSLVLYNRGHEAVTFELVFMDSPFWEEEVRFESLMNEAGPYHITIEGNTKQAITLDELINVIDIPNHIENGTANNVHIQLIDGKRVRYY